MYSLKFSRNMSVRTKCDELVPRLRFTETEETSDED